LIQARDDRVLSHGGPLIKEFEIVTPGNAEKVISFIEPEPFRFYKNNIIRALIAFILHDLSSSRNNSTLISKYEYHDIRTKKIYTLRTVLSTEINSVLSLSHG
jgi:hypothetical protein